MKSNYKKIGDYISQVNDRNVDGKTTTLLGINIDKYFMPSVANIVGTDMSVYKKVKKRQFACNRMHVGRDYRLPVAISNSSDDFIVSPAYDVFEIINTEELSPEYLMMWFSRKEYDRNAWFYTDADVRGGLNWKVFCDMGLPVPGIEKQKEIVKEYNVILDRVKLNNKLIQKLEESAKAIYKQWFVDFEFPNEKGKPYKLSGGKMEFNEELEKDIPIGWGVSTIDDEFNLTIGRTPPRIEEEWFNNATKNNIDWISIRDIVNSGSYIFNTNEKLSQEAVKRFSIPIIPKNTTILSFKMSVGNVAITTKDMLSNEAIAHLITSNKTILFDEFIYCFFKSFKFNKLGSTSSIVDSINTKMIKELKILIPTKEVIDNFHLIIRRVFGLKKDIEYQNILLDNLKSLLLSKLTTEN